MGQIVIAYWSGSGNTETMASMIAKGVEAAGGSAKVVSVDDIQPSELENEAVFALGCPAMGDEVLEETTMEPFVAEVEKFASGKKIGLFGSYGWGDGEWMRQWVDQMKNAGAEVLGGEDAICADAPDDEAEAKLIELGKKLAAC
ncbi:MAG: flavodoxin [Eubacteriales bacterium]|nr:flavodoxin [Eubacteriales bacterium]